jgi:hypothetical protein
MPYHPLLGSLRIPYDVLIALSDRHLQFQMQPYHHLIRIAHILSMAAFFGAIGLLDLRLMGIRGTVALKPFAQHALAWVYASFAVAFVSGVALFVYDPVHVGSHAYLTPKLALIALGLLNAAWFHRTSYVAALFSERSMPLRARAAGAVSLALWAGVIVCACLNTEAAPKVPLR